MSLIISQPLIEHCAILGHNPVKLRELAEIEKFSQSEFDDLDYIDDKIDIWLENEFLQIAAEGINPCPRCGSVNVKIHDNGYLINNTGHVECSACGLTKTCNNHYSDDDYINSWNSWCDELKSIDDMREAELKTAICKILSIYPDAISESNKFIMSRTKHSRCNVCGGNGKIIIDPNISNASQECIACNGTGLIKSTNTKFDKQILLTETQLKDIK